MHYKMNRSERRKFEKKLKEQLKINGKSKLAVPDKLRINDKIVLTKEIMMFDFDGNFIRKLQCNEKATYLGRKENPASNWDNWIYLKTDNEAGIVNPIGMINCFKFTEG